MNVEAIRGVQRAILERPDLYEQGQFFDVNNVCGGACCMAGWFVWNNDPEDFSWMADKLPAGSPEWAWRARDIADLDFLVADDLFNTSSGWTWPSPFCTRFDEAESAQDRAQIAADLLEHIIQNGGRM